MPRKPHALERNIRPRRLPTGRPSPGTTPITGHCPNCAPKRLPVPRLRSKIAIAINLFPHSEAMDVRPKQSAWVRSVRLA
jgi:hypothetical protein